MFYLGRSHYFAPGLSPPCQRTFGKKVKFTLLTILACEIALYGVYYQQSLVAYHLLSNLRLTTFDKKHLTQPTQVQH